MKRTARALARVAIVSLVWPLASAAIGCASKSATPVVESGAAKHQARVPKLEDAFDGDPDLLLVVRPRLLARDPLYGPLFRRASVLASSKANVAGVGTTALAAFERADETFVAVYDRGGRDAVIAVRGVPADVDVVTLVDTNGKPLWQRVHEEAGVTELVPYDPKSDAVLFVLPMRTWVIAVGDGVARATNVYMQRGVPAGFTFDVDPDALALVQMRGDAIAHHEVRLRVGPLAPIGRTLERVEIALRPGALGEWSGRFLYGTPAFASESEARMKEVLDAFSRKYGERMRWLNEIHVAAAGKAVTVRGKLPHAWVEGLLEAETGLVGVEDDAKTPGDPGTGPGSRVGGSAAPAPATSSGLAPAPLK